MLLLPAKGRGSSTTGQECLGQVEERKQTKKISAFLSESQSKDIVVLLRRGGKIVVKFGDIKIVSEIKVDRTWELEIFARIKEKIRETGDDSPEYPVKGVCGDEDGILGGVFPGSPGSGKGLDSKTPIRGAGGKQPRLLKKVEPMIRFLTGHFQIFL